MASANHGFQFSSGGSTTPKLFLGGKTSSYPAITRNGTDVDFKLGDASGFTNISALTTRTNAVAYASLPTGVLGMIATINDSDTDTWGATIGGAGLFTVLAFFNGTNWTVIGK